MDGFLLTVASFSAAGSRATHAEVSASIIIIIIIAPLHVSGLSATLVFVTLVSSGRLHFSGGLV